MYPLGSGKGICLFVDMCAQSSGGHRGRPEDVFDSVPEKAVSVEWSAVQWLEAEHRIGWAPTARYMAQRPGKGLDLRGAVGSVIGPVI